MDQKTKKKSGISGIAAAMLIFGTIGVFRKYIAFPSAFLAMCRGLLGAGFLFLYTRIRKLSRTPIPGKSLFRILLSGILIGMNWVCLFEAYRFTAVSVATMCYYMEPTFVILLSAFLFREKIGLKKGICVVLSFLGMILVSGVIRGSTGGTENTKGILLGLTAALLYSTVVLLNKTTPVEDIYTKTLLQLLLAGGILIPYVLITGEWRSVTPDALSVVSTVVLGLIHTGLAYALYFAAVQALPAQTTAILSYLDPAFALVCSALFLSEKITILSFLGMMMILFSAFFCDINLKTLKEKASKHK